jgi:hypothetical protein
MILLVTAVPADAGVKLSQTGSPGTAATTNDGFAGYAGLVLLEDWRVIDRLRVAAQLSRASRHLVAKPATANLGSMQSAISVHCDSNGSSLKSRFSSLDCAFIFMP